LPGRALRTLPVFKRIPHLPEVLGRPRSFVLNNRCVKSLKLSAARFCNAELCVVDPLLRRRNGHGTLRSKNSDFLTLSGADAVALRRAPASQRKDFASDSLNVDPRASKYTPARPV